ncbi:MAG: PEGA domain-containing protein [Myxococcales bacterium]|nr:PEGA domain-containing protein [Myxococcales bacterium]
MHTLLRPSISLLSVAIVAITTAANAQSAPARPEVTAQITEGRSLLARGLAQEALARFTATYEATRSPTARAHMGVAEGALGHPVEAEQHLSAALEAPRDAYMLPAWVDRFQENLRVARRSVGLFSVRSNVSGAEVFLNGRLVGTTPFAAPLRVRAETVRMRVVAAGHYPLEREVIVGGELAVTTETIELNPVPVVPAVVHTQTTSNGAVGSRISVESPPERPVIRPVVAPVIAPAQPTVVVVNSSRDTVEQRPGPSASLTGLAVAAGVLSVIGLGVGGVGTGLAAHYSREYIDADCVNRPDVIQCRDAKSTFELGSTMQVAGFVAGGVFGAATIGLAIGAALSVPSAPRRTGAMITCVPTAGSAQGVACGGRF